MSFLELVDAVRALEGLVPAEVAQVVRHPLTERPTANPHWTVWHARVQGPEDGFDVELWVPKETASTKLGRVMLRPHALTIGLGQIEARLGRGATGAIIPEIGDEGVETHVYDDERQRTSFQCTALSHMLLEVVVDRQAKGSR